MVHQTRGRKDKSSATAENTQDQVNDQLAGPSHVSRKVATLPTRRNSGETPVPSPQATTPSENDSDVDIETNESDNATKRKGRNANKKNIQEKNAALWATYESSTQFVLLVGEDACERCIDFERPCLWTISTRQTRCHSCGNQSCNLTSENGSTVPARVLRSMNTRLAEVIKEAKNGQVDDAQLESLRMAELAMEGVVEELDEGA